MSSSHTPSVKISSGKLKQANIVFQPYEAVRPTKTRIRQAIFNTLLHRFKIDFTKISVLDAFAGTGALGFEAASLGAPSVCFVEIDPLLSQSILSSIQSLGLSNVAQVLNANLFSSQRALRSSNINSFDLIFLDPPYFQKLLPQAMTFLANENLLSPSSILVAECHKHEFKDFLSLLPDSWSPLLARFYGKIAVSYFCLQPPSAESEKPENG